MSALFGESDGLRAPGVRGGCVRWAGVEAPLLYAYGR